MRRIERIAEGHPAVLAVPLLVDGQPRGTISLFYAEPREFGDEEVRLAAAFADQAALAIENTRLRAAAQERALELDRRRRVAEGLRELLAVVNSGRGLPAILDSVLDQAGKLLDGDAGAVYLLERPFGALTLQASRGHWPRGLAEELHLSESVTGLAVTQCRAIACDVLASVPPTSDIPPETELEDRGTYAQVVRLGGPASTRQYISHMRRLGRRYRMLLSVPLATPNETYGAISLFYRQPRDFADEEVTLAFAFADQAALAIENARLHAQSAQQLVELDALYRADEHIYGSLRLDQVLQALVDVASNMLQADKVAVSLEDVQAERRLTEMLRAPNAPEEIRSSMTAPIHIEEVVVGAFTLGYCQERVFSEQEKRLLAALAQRAGLAIQNARLYEQAQQAATLEERQRLARELHDAVTQTLFSTALIAEVIPALWDVDPVEGRQRLEELRRLTRGALAEMRTLLVELRPGALTGLPLEELLRQLGEAVAGRSRLLEVVVQADRPRRERLPVEVQVTLYRIAQEALNNIARHAQARHASVRVEHALDDALCLRIEDDGRGFDPTVVPAGHLGLAIMRERAQAIGAALQVESAPGACTQIEVRWQPRQGEVT